MIDLPAGRCRECGASISYFARVCPSCGAANLPNPVATLAAVGAVIVLGGVIALGLWMFRSKTPAAPPAANVPSAAPGTASDADYGWIVQAMAECEEEAKIRTEDMQFLIVPLTPSGVTIAGWSPVPISPIGKAGLLLNSTDALLGLRNRVYVLYDKPITFSISNPATGTAYKWKPATGVTALKTRETEAASLKLGFELAEGAGETEWGPTISLRKGTCYWINPLITTAGRKP
ncbi:MAG: hypothetical protein ACJ8F3_02315 [Xanthobacteraceae bacterium]